ncbi:alpha/beta hydrolase [Streptomyces sp. BR1]|uniref:alpha/beta hydrolase n=1 Tax=Streptomyces sp. BR1 TaxID=1592323 RepID=UPI00402B3CCD
MTAYRNRSLAVALSAAAVATALTATVAPTAHAGTGGPEVPQLDWTSCAGAGGQECAQLPVPLDYRHPDGPTLTLAVTRLRSDNPDKRRGVLLAIPGGPGGSGVGLLKEKGDALRKRMAGAYDIVSLDPRGVGGSTKASCELTPDDRMLVNVRSWPGQGGDISANTERSRRVADACHRNGGAVLRSFTTLNEARDIDLFRQALGERKLSGWGTSYGTYAGAVYAQLFPQHTDRWVLDSNDDPNPNRVGRGWLANAAQGTEDRFPDFAAWASDPAQEAKGLRLAERAEDVRPLVLGLAEKLDAAPRKTTTKDVPLTGNMLRQTLQIALMSDDSFPMMAQLVKEAQEPTATPALPPFLAQPLSDESVAVMFGVVCNDVSWPTQVSSYEQAVAADRVRHPLTAGMPVNVTPCTFWQDGAAEKPARITADGPSNVLLIQNRRDPASPYSGALKLRQALGDRARMVTVDHGGHEVYLANGNPCADRTVTTFLTTGQRPEDSVCEN